MLAYKPWRTRIWARDTDDIVLRDSRLLVSAEERRISITVSDEAPRYAKIEALSPEFASTYGSNDLRWINSIKVSGRFDETVATVLPYNTFDRRWPPIGLSREPVVVGSEGWSLGQEYKHATETLRLLSHEEAIVGWLKSHGIDAALSEPGRIAKQVLGHLGGLWDVQLLQDIETLNLLNDMAGGRRRRKSGENETDEVFDPRSRPLKVWKDLISRRVTAKAFPRIELSDFTDRNIIRLGVETDCPYCKAVNWYSLAAVDYEVRCNRCLKDYKFPQAAIRPHNQNWVYRVIGPFSTPDYARGAYSALLALHVINRASGLQDTMTFAPAMSLQFDGIRRELDFIAWHAPERFGDTPKPTLVIGEAKSLAEGSALKAVDVQRLKDVASKLPGAVIAIAILREDFSEAERTLLQSLAKWGRRPDAMGDPTNPLLLLTRNELLFNHDVRETWKELGGRYAPFGNDRHMRSLSRFADATLGIYLGLPSYDEERRALWERRTARRKARARNR